MRHNTQTQCQQCHIKKTSQKSLLRPTKTTNTIVTHINCGVFGIQREIFKRLALPNIIGEICTSLGLLEYDDFQILLDNYNTNGIFFSN